MTSPLEQTDSPVSVPLKENSATNSFAPRQATERIYSGIWGVLSRVFRVPIEPPQLPHEPGETYRVFKPSVGFLNYLRLQFVGGLIVAAVVMLIGLGSISVANYIAALVGLPLAIAVEVISAIIGFLAIHLRYDTTWYVLNDRSLRLRRGIWVIRETTITFENIQNVRVRQGPLQRLFGISSLVVETAGGGSVNMEGKSEGHTGLIEGISHADEIRDLILSQTAKRKSTFVADSGLGDEVAEEDREDHRSAWQPEQVALLSEIRELIYTL